ncbi:Nn.00g065090.m01.CDS01 [Neocucurbitaria sp. VM-36]
MNATKVLQQGRQPMIRFLGKRTTPTKVDHTPHAHPASPTHELPSSFASYRKKAQQHGPLNTVNSAAVGGHIGGAAGRTLGPIEAAKGMFFDRSELPERFQRLSWTQAEIEAVESGGASQFA